MLSSMFWIALSCAESNQSDSASPYDASASPGVDTGETTDGSGGGLFGDPKQMIGADAAPFALVDLNPTSATYGLTIDSADYAGMPYAVLFLDSRCLSCVDLIRDVWASYEDHPAWWDAMPTVAIQRAGISAEYAKSVEAMLEGHSMPYLEDTEEFDLWGAYAAINHDFFVVSGDGVVETWLDLYLWPDGLATFEGYMTDRWGEGTAADTGL